MNSPNTTNKLHVEFPHDYLLQKVGDPRPFIGTGGVPSPVLFSPAFCFPVVRPRRPLPRSVRGISSQRKPINSPSPAIRYIDNKIELHGGKYNLGSCAEIFQGNP